MSIYYCNNCGQVFDKPDVKRVDENHYVDICTFCESEDFTDAGECEMCSQPMSPHIDICEDCRKYLQTEFERMAKEKEIDYLHLLNGIEEFINE